MKNTLVLLILCMSFTFINGQENSTFISGKIVLDSIAIVDVHVINKNSQIGTITNDNGLFEIPVQLGDSLFFSHLKFQDKLILITPKILSNKTTIITLKEKTVVLNEMVLEKQRSIFYQDPEIITYNGPVVNAETLHLPYANTVVEKDESILKFQSGGVINLDNLINSLNGNNKREKLLQKLVTEDTQLEKIRKQFTDDFFVTDLKIQKEYINQFLNDCIDKNIIRIFKSNNILKLTKLLMNQSKLYPHKIMNEDLFLTKKWFYQFSGKHKI